jgi:HEAT repeat protein
LTVVLLKDSFVHARAAAAKTLGQIGDPNAVPALAAALGDSEHEVQVNAAKSIGLLTGQKFTDINAKGFSLDKNGNPIIVIEALDWWNKQGRLQDWVQRNR